MAKALYYLLGGLTAVGMMSLGMPWRAVVLGTIAGAAFAAYRLSD